MLKTLTRPARHVVMLLDTVIHEVGHTVVLLPLGTTLSIRVRADGTGVTHGSTGVAGDGWLAAPPRVINLMAGYAAPLLFGLLILLTAWQETVIVSGWWPVVGVMWLVSAFLTTLHLSKPGALVLIASWVVLVLALVNAPSLIDTTRLTGAQLVLFLLAYVGAVIVLSIRSLFTLVAAALWVGVVALLALPFTSTDTHTLGVVILTCFGALLFLSGLFSIIGIARTTPTGGESDFHLLSQEFGGSALGWFIFFTLTVAVVIAVVMVVFFTGITV